MKRLIRIFIWGFFLLLLLGFVILPLVFRTDYVQDRLASYVKEATASAPVTISFSQIMPDILSCVEIRDLEVTSPAGTIARVETLTVGPLLPGILGEEKSLGSVMAENVQTTIKRDAQGVWNASRWFPKGEKKEFKGLPIVIPKVVIKNANVKLIIKDPDGKDALNARIVADLSGGLQSTGFTVSKAKLVEAGNASYGTTQIDLKGQMDLVAPMHVKADAEVRTDSLERWRAIVPQLPSMKDVKATIRTQGPLKKQALEFTAAFEPEQSVEGRAQLDFSRPEPELRCQVKVNNLQAQTFVASVPALINGNLEAQAQGKWPALDVSARADLHSSRYKGYSVSKASAVLTLDRGGHADLRLDGTVNQAHIKFNADGMAQGLYDQNSHMDLQFSGACSNLNPARMVKHSRDLSGDINLDLKGSLKKEPEQQVRDAIVALQTHIKPSSIGKVDIASGDVSALISRTGVTVQEAILSGMDAEVTFSGQTDYAGNGNVNASAKILNLEDVTALLSQHIVKGIATIEVDAQGNLAKPQFQASVQATSVEYDEYAIGRTTFSGSGNMETLAFLVKGEAGNLTLKGQSLDSLAFSTNLDKESIGFSVDVAGGVLDSLSSKGRVAPYLEPDKTLYLDALSAAYQDRTVALQSPATLVISPKGVATPGLTLACEGQTLTLEGKYEFSGGAINATAIAPDLDLETISHLARVSKVIKGKGELAASVKGSLSNPVLDVKIRTEQVKVRDDVPGLAMEAFAQYQDGLASLQAAIKPKTGGKLDAKAALPIKLGIPFEALQLPESGLDASFEAKGLDLAALPQWVQGLTAISGTLDVDGTIMGDPKSPRFRGNAHLVASTMEIKSLPDPITDVKALLEWTPQEIRIKEISAHTQKEGELDGSGVITLENLKPERFDISCNTRKFDLAVGRMFQARTDADLNLVGQWPQVDVTGSITFGEGEFRLDRFMEVRRRQVAVEQDVQIKGEEVQKKESPLKPFGIDVRLLVEGPMWVKGDGAQIQFDGDLHATKARNSEDITCNGLLETIRGMYEFRGKSFDVEEGRIDFVGLSPPDPNLAIKTSRKVAGVTIYLEIGGSPSEITLTLSADPVMDQTDIASLLLFGKRASDLTSGESKTLEEQGTAILAARALDEFKRVLGTDVPLDMVSVQSGDKGVAQDLVLGKYLSPKLFITYRRQMSSDGSNQVQLEYQLTPKISVESQIGESESGMDIFWNFDY